MIGYSINLVLVVFAFVGVAVYIITSLQLGLDQMPDASSDNITSFITWFLFAIIFGLWLVETVHVLLTNCIDIILLLWFPEVLSLFPTILMSIVCCSLFLLSSKLLIIEPNCPQSLKTVYQVLKFAWKHKSPLNRSALTYWEENVPSRIDLGKSRYGGPFTTEQVEDVKTFFKIIIILLPISLSTCFLIQGSVTKLLPSDIDTKCKVSFIFSFTFNPKWVMIVALVVYELVFPLIRNRLPSILKRIGIILFLAFVLNVLELVIAVLYINNIYLPWWFSFTYFVPLVCIFAFLLANLLEFACAQSPYKMRGLLLGYVLFMYLISFLVNISIIHNFPFGDVEFKYLIITSSVFTTFSLVGFVLYCLVARWYKMRVRDENYDVHRVVEEVYDRYLSQRETL